MMIKFRYADEVIWTGELGFPIPRIGEHATFHFPDVDPDDAMKCTIADVGYDVNPGLGHSACIVDLIPMADPEGDDSRTPPLTQTELIALFAMWTAGGFNTDMKNSPLMAEIFIKLARTV